MGIFSGGKLLQIALPPLQTQTAFGSHFDYLLTSPGSISVHEQLHIAPKKSSNGHVIFLHEIQITHLSNNHSASSAKQKEYRSLTIVYADGRCKLKMRAGFSVTSIDVN